MNIPSQQEEKGALPRPTLKGQTYSFRQITEEHYQKLICTYSRVLKYKNRKIEIDYIIIEIRPTIQPISRNWEPVEIAYLWVTNDKSKYGGKIFQKQYLCAP